MTSEALAAGNVMFCVMLDRTEMSSA